MCTSLYTTVMCTAIRGSLQKPYFKKSTYLVMNLIVWATVYDSFTVFEGSVIAWGESVVFLFFPYWKWYLVNHFNGFLFHWKPWHSQNLFIKKAHISHLKVCDDRLSWIFTLPWSRQSVSSSRHCFMLHNSVWKQKATIVYSKSHTGPWVLQVIYHMTTGIKMMKCMKFIIVLIGIFPHWSSKSSTMLRWRCECKEKYKSLRLKGSQWWLLAFFYHIFSPNIEGMRSEGSILTLEAFDSYWKPEVEWWGRWQALIFSDPGSSSGWVKMMIPQR